MQTRIEMQPEDIHGTHTTEPTVMKSVDRAIEHVAACLGISMSWFETEGGKVLGQEAECQDYIKKILAPEAWAKFESVVLKGINANTHEIDHRHIERNRPEPVLNMENIFLNKPLFEDPSGNRHARNGEKYHVKKHLVAVYMALNKFCTGSQLENRLEHFMATISYLLEANVCNLGWRNALYMVLNGVVPGLEIIPDMDQFLLNTMLSTIRQLMGVYIKEDEKLFMRVFVGEVAQQRDPAFQRFLETPYNGSTVFVHVLFIQLQKSGVHPEEYQKRVRWILPDLNHTFNDYSSHEQQWVRELTKIFKVRAFENETRLINAIQRNLQANYVNNQENVRTIAQLGKILDSYFVYQECKFLVSHWSLHNCVASVERETLTKEDIDTLDTAFLSYIQNWQSTDKLGERASDTLLKLSEKFDRLFYKYSVDARPVNKFFEEWHKGSNKAEKLKILCEASLKPDWFVDDFLLHSSLPVIKFSDQSYQQKLSSWCNESWKEYRDLFLGDKELLNLLAKPLFLEILIKIEKNEIFKNNNELQKKWLGMLSLPKFRMLLNDTGFLRILDKNLIPLLAKEKFLNLLTNSDFMELLFHCYFRKFLSKGLLAESIKSGDELLDLFNLLCKWQSTSLLKMESFLEFLLEDDCVHFLKCTNFLQLLKNDMYRSEYLGDKRHQLKTHVQGITPHLRPGIDLNTALEHNFWSGIKVIKAPEMLTLACETDSVINLSYDIINRIFLHAVTVHPEQWSEPFYNALSFIYDFCKNDFSNPEFNIKFFFHQKPYKDTQVLNQIKYLLETYVFKKILSQVDALELDFSAPELPVISIPMLTDQYKNHFNNFRALLSLTNPEEQLSLVKNNFHLINDINKFEQLLSCISLDSHGELLALFDVKLNELSFVGEDYTSLVRCFSTLDKNCVRPFANITISYIGNIDLLVEFLSAIAIENQEDFIPFINACFYQFEISSLSSLRALFEVLDYKVQDELLDGMPIEKLAKLCLKATSLNDFMDEISDEAKQTILDKLGKPFIERLYPANKLANLLDFWSCKLKDDITAENEKALQILLNSNKRKGEFEEGADESACKRQRIDNSEEELEDDFEDAQDADFENEGEPSFTMDFDSISSNRNSMFNSQATRRDTLDSDAKRILDLNFITPK